MRCIEMGESIMPIGKLIMININMRCIEMTLELRQEDFGEGLTLTWDVLKFVGDCKKVLQPWD